MRKNFTPNSIGCFLLLWSVMNFSSCAPINPAAEVEKEDGPAEVLKRDNMMMQDPALGYVPTDRLLAAKDYKDQLMAQQTNAALSGVVWKSLGPKNQGGRTRALLVDASDATGNTVFAGSVGGGLWKTTNISAVTPTWSAVDDLMGNLAITCIVQDPSNLQTMYLTTGEGYGNGDAIRGNGVFKSTNGGTTWSQLAATNISTFNYNQRAVVTSTGVLLVATNGGGLQRSTNGGTSFTKVLGTGLGIIGANSNLCYDVEIAANGDIYATLNGSIHKSLDGGATWSVAMTLPISAGRIEVACAPSDANYIYALVELSSAINGILKSTNGGATWSSVTEPADADSGIPAADFSRTQAWYDLSIVVDPNHRDSLFVGGVDLFRSTNGGTTWSQMTHWYGGFGYQYMHADQHLAYFRPGSSTEAYFTNDGGVFRTDNANAATPTISDKGAGYVTAQFYACAMSPTALTPYYLAGAQDNGSHQFSSLGMVNTVQVTGGDGAYVHIDQDQPQYQFTSYVNQNYYRSADGGATFASAGTTGGMFINPTDYDDLNNIMYCSNGTNNYTRWDNPQTGTTFTTVTATTFGGQVSAIKVSPNTANRVFFGMTNGRLVRADNANTATPTFTLINTGLPGAYLNCVEVETGNDNHILVTFTNYGVNSVWESLNGGTSWTSVEGNLPDMPIRWALFNPNNSDQALLATELGVWSTDNLNGVSTVWGASNSGLANVSVDMLQVRASDKLVIAATHGRGLFSSDIFTTPTALFTADNQVAYRNSTINFTSTSYKATSWSWDFGDGQTSTLENPSHAYAAAGRYNVTLSINSGASTLVKSSYIHILPNRGTPYALTDGGNFEVNTDDFDNNRLSGTSWQLGNSAVAGKNGTHGGTNAWVTGLTGNYVDNSDASVWTPNYNFAAAGTYTVRFWAKYNTEVGYDGIRLEYSLNKGTTWLPVGTTVAANWYNFANTVGDAAFPANEAFFNGNVAAYTQYTRDISFLAGNTNVAFRIHFKSDGGVVAPGVAFDDFEILGPSNLPIPLSLTSFQAYRSNNDVMLNWTTENELNVSGFSIERSLDGSNFVAVGNVPARNGSINTYNQLDAVSQLNPRPTGYLYYRLKMIDKDGNFKYSPVARIAMNKATELTVGPNPFTDMIYVYSNEKVNGFALYDMSGKMIWRTNSITGNSVNVPSFISKGVYMAAVETASGIYKKQIVK